MDNLGPTYIYLTMCNVDIDKYISIFQEVIILGNLMGDITESVKIRLWFLSSASRLCSYT